MAVGEYERFLSRKRPSVRQNGLTRIPALNGKLLPFQENVIEYCLSIASGAAFLDTGLGKTFIQLEWARVVSEIENKPIIILTPLAVAAQTKAQADHFGIDSRIVREQSQVRNGINIANYEIIHKLDTDAFCGVVLDESSIVKSYTGKVSNRLIDAFSGHRWRLACTATPAPNDHMELGQHSAFLGAMPSNEMLSRWFIADQDKMAGYRLKGHAVKSFWEWVASWSRCAGLPSDLGDYDDTGFILPELIEHKHIISADITIDTGGMLFRMPEMSATSVHKEKRLTCDDRADAILEIVDAESNEPWSIWCDTDYEADALIERIPDAVEVRGSQRMEEKEEKLIAFSNGQARMLISKPSVCGYGMNWQHCARTAFVGQSFSFQAKYQALRRHHRFGQTRSVHCHDVMADTELAIWNVVQRKARDHEVMKKEMSLAMKRAQQSHNIKLQYAPTVPIELPTWITGV